NRRRANSHKIARQDDEFKTEDNKRRAKVLKIARQDDEFKTEDNKRRAKAHKSEGQDDEFKTEDNKRRAEALKIARQDDEFKEEDNKRRAEALKIARQDDEFKEEERRRNALRIHNNRDKYKSNFDDMKSNYESKIKEGPTHICSCCGGLWFEYSIREYTVEMLTNKGLKAEFIDTLCYLKHAIIKLCVTCRKDIMSNKIPNLSLSNGLAFYEVPNCLKILTELEERLISPRIPFMVIRSLGSCKQFGLKETFELNKDLIQQKRSEYIHREANEFEKAFEEQTERGNDDDIDDTNIEYDQDKNEFLIYETGNNEGDIFVEMGINTRTEKVEHFNVPKMIPDADYQRLMRSLNNNQRRYILNVMNLIKNGDKQCFHFINGGAGVGKSTLIKAVYQSILRFYNSLPGSNPETIRTAICAPTGKAAALIDGMTLHSFLSLPNWSEIERSTITNHRRNINGWFYNVSTR
ncbi:unnamed protein product, partial [Rotaria sordida]